MRSSRMCAIFRGNAGVAKMGFDANAGNVCFEPNAKDEAVVIGATTEFMQNAADLLGIDVADLQKKLTTRLVQTKGESYDVPNDVTSASCVRDAISKSCAATRECNC